MYFIAKMIKFQHYESLFSYVFIFFLIANGLLVKNLIQVRKTIVALGVEVMPADKIFIGIIVIGIIIYAIRKLIRHSFYDWVYINMKPKYQGLNRHIRALKVTKWIFDMWYYGFTTFTGIYLFRNTNWFPYELGGHGEDQYILSSYPNIDSSCVDKLAYFYILQSSKHITSLFELILQRRNEEFKFYEFLTHHLMAVCLILFSYFSNFVIAGVVVLVVHDMSDFFMSIVRAVDDMKATPKWLTYSLFVLAVSSWTITRIYIFPKTIVYQAMLYFWHFFQTVYFETFFIQTTMIVGLLLMHIYWIIFIVHGGLQRVKATMALPNDKVQT